MTTLSHIPSDEIRSRFSHAMSAMYRQEVPQYGTLLDLVAEINETTLRSNPELWKQLVENGELDRLEVERHGAIRLGTVALDHLFADGYVKAEPLIYEDFLPVSAAGIFQSNLGEDEQKSYNSNAAKAAFEEALGRCVLDEIALYQATEWRSIEATRALLRGGIENAK